MPTPTYHVYIMASASRRLYTGVTRQLERRVTQHRTPSAGAFTRRYNMTNLVYVESTVDARAALRREKQIKGWLRAKKIALIESLNPEWRDFAANWFPALELRDPSLRSG